MPPAPEPQTSLVEAARRIAAADRAGQIRGLHQLGKWAARPAAAVNAFNAFLATGKDGPRLALEFIARMPGNVPHSLLFVAAPLLSSPVVPIAVKLTVAARFVESLPDQPETIGPILRALTAGLKKGKSLARLIALQSRVAKCDSLDAAIAKMELKTRLKCPICSRSFSRPALIRHLWKKHHSTYDQGKVVSPERQADELVSNAKGNDPARLDSAFLMMPALFPNSTPTQILQGLASRNWRSSDQYAHLADEAGESNAGLCPKCYAPVADAVVPMPPPLILSHGRLSGEGIRIAVEDFTWSRRIRIEQQQDVSFQNDVLGKRSPRAAAVLSALPVAILAIIAAVFLPKFSPGPGWTAIWLSVVALLLYAAMFAFRRPLPPANGRAVDTAWNELVGGIGRSPAAARFLTRLCRTSFNSGDPIDRSKLVWEMADHSAVLIEKGGPYIPFFAAAEVLRAVDAGKIGRDLVGELASLFSRVFQGGIPSPAGELMAALVDDDVRLSAGERSRLTLVLAQTAFESGLVPADIPPLRRHLPRLVGLLPSDFDDLLTLFAVWKGRGNRPWENAANCESILALAKSRPAAAIRALKADPDAVLVHQPEEFIADVLGPVTVNRRGVSLGGVTVSDPRAEVSVVTTKEGGELTFGKSIFALVRRPHEKIERTLRKLLRYRAEELMPQVDGIQNEPPSGRGEMLLAPLAVPCPLCRTVSLIRAGQLGVAPK